MTDDETPAETPLPEVETPPEPEAIPATPAAETLVDKANAAAERLEAANKKGEELLNRKDEQMVAMTLGGKAEVNTRPKEETPKDYAKKVMANDTET